MGLYKIKGCACLSTYPTVHLISRLEFFRTFFFPLKPCEFACPTAELTTFTSDGFHHSSGSTMLELV